MRFAFLLASFCWATFGQTSGIDAEAMRHFDALVRIDSTDPPGNETRVVDYVKKVFDAEGIAYTVVAQDAARANIIARIKGNGSRRPLLIVGHSDTVKVDPSKWTYPPFSAEHHDGYVYGRGTRDDKSDLLAAMMTMVMLKRAKTVLDRDVIFLCEAGEEATTGPGIEFVVNEHWKEIDAEICLAEAGGVFRKAGKPLYGFLETTEKQPMPMHLTVKGTAGHGSIPLRNNAVAHLSKAVSAIASWDPPMRFNDTTRTYFEKLAALSTPEDAARLKGLFDPAQAPAIREYYAEHDPLIYSLLHT
jgi:acetylornithine deacetylase/succinyl-diaminopimelate desuccinylase-like protein